MAPCVRILVWALKRDHEIPHGGRLWKAVPEEGKVVEQL